MHYIEAYNILGLDPSTASFKQLRNLEKKEYKTKYKHTEYRKEYRSAINCLKTNHPINDGLSDRDLLKAFKKKNLLWQEYYQKYHINFEQQLDKINTILIKNAVVTVIIPTFYTFLNVFDVVNDDHNIFLILSITGFVMSLDNFYQNTKLKKQPLLKEFDELRKINKIIRKRYTK